MSLYMVVGRGNVRFAFLKVIVLSISIEEFAKKLGITAQSLCDIEKGRRTPSVDRASKIAKKLKEPAEIWIAIALSDMVRVVRTDLRVEVKKQAS